MIKALATLSLSIAPFDLEFKANAYDMIALGFSCLGILSVLFHHSIEHMLVALRHRVAEKSARKNAVPG